MPESITHSTPTRMCRPASTVQEIAVVDEHGEALGRITDVMLDLEQRNIAYVEITFGGWLGVGAQLFPMPPAQLTFDVDRDIAILAVDRDRIRSAPSYDVTAKPTHPTPGWLDSVYAHYSGFAAGD